MKRSRRIWLLVWMIAMASHPAPVFSDDKDRKKPASEAAAGHDRPTGMLRQSRSPVLAKNGMVASSHPEATRVGVEILRRGGNAADAAIAVNAVLSVVEPMMCGPGGDLFCLYWDAESEKLYGLNASGRSPGEISLEAVAAIASQSGDESNQAAGPPQIPVDSPASWTVPGCVSGWQTLNGRFGSLPLAELLAPAIETAEEGFPVSEIVAADWQSQEAALRAHPGSAEVFLPEGRAPRHGEVVKLPQLARTLKMIADKGPEAFYQGEIARKLVEFSEAEGGFFTLQDFSQHRADWIEPVSTDYRGYRVWQMPPNGQGISVLQMLGTLEPFDLKSFGPGNPDYLHRFIEAKKLAFADRARYYADPKLADVPTEELISKAYGLKQSSRIDPERAADDVPAGDPRAGAGDTVYLTVVDKDRNVCSLIQSVYHLFGSKRTPPELGFVLQNRGASFALDENHLNRLEPNKRPFHTIIPSMVTRDGHPWFTFGVMGGDMQPQGQVQVLVNMIDFGMNVQAAGDAARVRHEGSASPTGLAGDGGGRVIVESGIPESAVTELQNRGHQVTRSRSGYGGYQGILIDRRQGVLHGGTDPRKDGAALGY